MKNYIDNQLLGRKRYSSIVEMRNTYDNQNTKDNIDMKQERDLIHLKYDKINFDKGRVSEALPVKNYKHYRDRN